MYYGKIHTMKTKTVQLNKKIEWLQRKYDGQGLTVAKKDSLIALQQARLAFLKSSSAWLNTNSLPVKTKPILDKVTCLMRQKNGRA
jgi:oligoribonuclease (3'-5' exoribonuclease)